jgi:ubiquinone/menaquinone biosynthesis C-methylase UbiE
MTHETFDVPSPIDLKQMDDAAEWERTATLKRPWRADFFDLVTAEIEKSDVQLQSVLELGSGPGFLAHHVLSRLPHLQYGLLDFSSAMHELARKRLGHTSWNVAFFERNFREPTWAKGFENIDCVVTHQAVHELRHKRHAATLHAEVQRVLAPNGMYLVCDHFAGPGGMENDKLYMSADEQKEALHAAGFTRVDRLLMLGGLVLHRARVD